MSNRSLSKCTLLFIVMVSGYFFFNNSVIAEDPLKDEEITKIAPKENSIDKILFIKNNFEKNKKYTDIGNEKTFKNILIGSWFLPPAGGIEFKSDGRFEAQRSDDEGVKNFYGFWEFSDGTLRLSSNKITWEKYRVKDYNLWFKDIGRLHQYGKWDKEAYSFSISFDKMICDMSSVLQISFSIK